MAVRIRFSRPDTQTRCNMCAWSSVIRLRGGALAVDTAQDRHAADTAQDRHDDRAQDRHDDLLPPLPLTLSEVEQGHSLAATARRTQQGGSWQPKAPRRATRCEFVCKSLCCLPCAPLISWRHSSSQAPPRTTHLLVSLSLTCVYVCARMHVCTVYLRKGAARGRVLGLFPPGLRCDAPRFSSIQHPPALSLSLSCCLFV